VGVLVFLVEGGAYHNPSSACLVVQQVPMKAMRRPRVMIRTHSRVILLPKWVSSRIMSLDMSGVVGHSVPIMGE
jgi:hypothetical protein